DEKSWMPGPSPGMTAKVEIGAGELRAGALIFQIFLEFSSRQNDFLLKFKYLITNQSIIPKFHTFSTRCCDPEVQA
ncbi:MAG: hypothetical protein ACOVLI_01580, partial [Rhabdaerophilum sp.]